MGAIISAIAGIGELVAATGFTADALIAGEAAAALEAQISALVTIEGVTTADALAELGITAESLSLASSLPGLLEEATTYAILLKTLSGAGGIIAASTRYFRNDVVSDKTVPGLPTFVFPESRWLLDSFHYVDPLRWGPSLFEQTSGSFWHYLKKHKHMIYRDDPTARLAWQLLESTMQNSNWYLIYTDASIGTFGRLASERRGTSQRIEKQHRPGGAGQSACPDWLLPLILGLSGDLTPTLAAELTRLSSDGTQKGKKRAGDSSEGTPAPNKRRR